MSSIDRIKRVWGRERPLLQMERAIREDIQLQRAGQAQESLGAYDDARDYAEVARRRGASLRQIASRAQRAREQA